MINRKNAAQLSPVYSHFYQNPNLAQQQLLRSHPNFRLKKCKNIGI